VAGRDGYPWYRSDRRCWYVWHENRQVRLAADKAEAFKQWHGLLNGPSGGPTVEDLVGEFLADPKEESTLRAYRRILDSFTSRFGGRPAAGVQSAEVMSWSARPSWGDSSRWLALTVVSAAFNRAVRQGRLKDNPLRGISKPPLRSRGATVLLAPESRKSLLDAAPPWLRTALSALHDTGCRPAELVCVEASHFDPVGGTWRLDKHKTAKRSGRPRVIVLTDALAQLCRELAARHPTGPLFRDGDDRPLKPRTLSDWTYKLRRRLGLPGAMPYSFRHGLATDALLAGVPDVVVSALLGHTNPSVLHRFYSHVTARSGELREALGRVRRGGAEGGGPSDGGQ
jgi:integrase/recombinase XerC